MMPSSLFVELLLLTLQTRSFCPFCFVFVLSQSLIMPPKFKAVPQIFGNPDGICSLAMAEKVGIHHVLPLDDPDIIPLVVYESPPALTKVRTACSHLASKADVKHLGASTQFYAPPAALSKARLKAETLDLNPPVETTGECSLARLDKLRKNHVGGILLAVKHWNDQKAAFGKPVLQVVADPAVASLGAFDALDPPEINLGEVWDLAASSPLDQLPVNNTTCPIMVSAGGFSRAVTPLAIAN
jgi:hypothetical protein